MRRFFFIAIDAARSSLAARADSRRRRRMSASVILRCAALILVLQQSIGAGHDLDGMLRLASPARLCRPSRPVRLTCCTMCCAASGQSETIWPRACCAAVRNTGRPTFTATACVGFTTPKVPPWPEQRSITSTGVSRDEAQHLGRLRAHVLRARVAGQMHGHAFGQRLHAVGQAFLLRDVDDIFVDVEASLRRRASRSHCRARSAAIRISASARRTPSSATMS